MGRTKTQIPSGVVKGKGTKPQKSGDSTRQDQAAAQEEALGRGETHVEDMITETQAAVDEAKENGASQNQLDEITAHLKNLVQIVTRQDTEITSLRQKLTLVDAGKPGRSFVPQRLRCGICRQEVIEKHPTTGVTLGGACTGNPDDHVTIYLAPDVPHTLPDFQGFTRNGIRYLGRCHVPRAMAHDLMSSLRRWQNSILTFHIGQTGRMGAGLKIGPSQRFPLILTQAQRDAEGAGEAPVHYGSM